MWWSTLVGRLEGAGALDPLTAAAGQVVDRVLPKGPLKDALHGTWLGHPVHPLLVAVPIGLWTGTTLLDLTGGSRSAARRLVGAGVLAAAPSVAAGWADWSELGTFERPKRVGLVHAAANAVTTAVYAASWVARARGDHGRGRDLALAGSLGLAVGGYLGGHLAYSEGVGVNRNADEQPEPTTWTDACDAADLAPGQLLRVEVGEQQVVLVERGGQVFAMSATCSHLGGPLEQGEVVPGDRDGDGDGDGACLVCPWHESRFRLRDGGVARGPATSPQRAYDVRTAGGRLQVRVRR